MRDCIRLADDALALSGTWEEIVVPADVLRDERRCTLSHRRINLEQHITFTFNGQEVVCSTVSDLRMGYGL